MEKALARRVEEEVFAEPLGLRNVVRRRRPLIHLVDLVVKERDQEGERCARRADGGRAHPPSSTNRPRKSHGTPREGLIARLKIVMAGTTLPRSCRR